MKIYATLTRSVKMTEEGEPDLENMELDNQISPKEASGGAKDMLDPEINVQTDTIMESAHSFATTDL